MSSGKFRKGIDGAAILMPSIEMLSMCQRQWSENADARRKRRACWFVVD
jgi:hypothetical protein